MTRFSQRFRLTGGSEANSVNKWFGGGFAALPIGDFDSIATTTVGSGGQTTISFTSIPATYAHLQLRVMARSTFADTDSIFIVRVNSDTGNNYPNHFLQGGGGTPGAFGYTSATYNYAFLLTFPGANASASFFGGGVIDILDYKNTNKYKTIRAFGGHDRQSAGDIRLNSSVWLNTNAITSITITDYRTGNFAEYSSFALYGIN